MTKGQPLKKGRIRVSFRETPEDPFPFLRGSAVAGETGKYHSGNGVKDSGEFQLQEHAVDLAGFFINIFRGKDLTGPVREPFRTAQTGENRQICRHKIASDG